MKTGKTLTLIIAVVCVFAFLLTSCSTTPTLPGASASSEQSASASAAEPASQEASAAAESKAPAAGEKIKIGMSIPQLANPYFVSVMNGCQAKCDELGYELIPVDAKYDVAKQVSDFENFANQGVNAVIACPIDSNALVQVVDKLKSQGIIVISFAQVIENANSIFTLDEYKYGVVIGENAAKWINEKLGGKAQVLIISQDNVEAVVQRGNGIQDTIEKLCPESEVVARQAGDNPEKGMKIAEDVLQQYPDVKVITGNNDAGPLGAYEAVKAMGKNTDDFYIGGGDATPEAIEKMKEEGSVYRATVDLEPYTTGVDCVSAIADMLANGIPDEAPVNLFNMTPVWQEDVVSGKFVPKG
jgi:ribose transport system substrate-binding protein